MEVILHILGSLSYEFMLEIRGPVGPWENCRCFSTLGTLGILADTRLGTDFFLLTYARLLGGLIIWVRIGLWSTVSMLSALCPYDSYLPIPLQPPSYVQQNTR